MELKDKVIAITGGASGLGEASTTDSSKPPAIQQGFNSPSG